MRLTIVLVLLVAIAGPDHARDRFHLVRDPASRYDFRHVQDRETGLWVHIQCELRVPATRVLPDPLSTPETGDLVSYTQFTSISMGSAGIVPGEFEVRDGQRIWLWRTLADDDMLAGTAQLGVQARWPGPPGSGEQREPMELFELPPLNSMEPYRWSPWRVADEVRGGYFAGWGKLHGEAPDGSPAPAEPYSLRCRPVLADYLHVPIAAEDPNVGKPEPALTH